MGRHRHYFPALLHGAGFLVPQIDERRHHGACHHGRNRMRDDVSGLYGRQCHGILAHEQYLPRRYALHVIHGHRLQSVRRHGTAAAEVYRYRSGHSGRRGSCGRRHVSRALHTGYQQTFRGRRHAGERAETGRFSHLLVRTGHLPYPNSIPEISTFSQRRDSADRLVSALFRHGHDRHQSRILGGPRGFRHGIVAGRNSRIRPDRSARAARQGSLRRCFLRFGRHDGRSDRHLAVYLPDPHPDAIGAGRAGVVRELRSAALGTASEDSRPVGASR